MKQHPYFDKPGLSSGNLAKFWNGGEYCPDAVSGPIADRYLFALGRMFEAACVDAARDGRTFFEKYYVSEISGDVPDSVICAIHDNDGDELRDALQKLEIMTKEKRNKKGEITEPARRNMTYSSQHAYMDECLDPANFGKMPISQPNYKTMKFLAEKICELKFPGWHPLAEYLVGDYLAGCETQTEHYWTQKGIQKKALADCLYCDSGLAILADIKWTSSFSQFSTAFAGKHWLQATHYERGVEIDRKAKCPPMLFFVGCSGGKNDPPLAQIWYADQKNRDQTDREYDALCDAYAQWEADGKPKVGKLAERKQRVWIRGKS